MRIAKVSLLTAIVFCILKWCSAVGWDWGWVLTPLWLFIGAVLRESEIESVVNRDLTNV